LRVIRSRSSSIHRQKVSVGPPRDLALSLICQSAILICHTALGTCVRCKRNRSCRVVPARGEHTAVVYHAVTAILTLLHAHLQLLTPSAPHHASRASQTAAPAYKHGQDHIGCQLTHLSLGRIRCYERPRWSHDGRITRGAHYHYHYHYHEQRVDSRQRDKRYRHGSTRDSREGRAATTLARNHPHTPTRG
jgi:hypothetical protein